MKKLIFLLLFIPTMLVGQGKLHYTDTIKVKALCTIPADLNTEVDRKNKFHDMVISKDNVFTANLLQIRFHRYLYDPKLLKKGIGMPIKVTGYLWEDKTPISSVITIWRWEEIKDDTKK